MAHSDSLQDVIEELCTQLSLSELSDQVFSYIQGLEEASHSQPFELNELIACTIYVSMIEARFVYGSLESQLLNSGLMPNTVTNLLKVTNVRVSEFLKRMRTLQDKLLMSNAVGQHLTLVQHKFLVSCPLYRKLEKMCSDVFANGCVRGSGLDGQNLSEKALCWLMYITIKSSMQQQEGSLKLAESFHLLLCCVEHVIWMVLPPMLHSPFYSLKHVTTSEENCILKELCRRYGANLDEVKCMKSNYFELEVQNLPLLDGRIDVSQLVGNYSVLHKQLGDIDELDFLRGEFYLSTHCLQVSPAEQQIENFDTPVGQAMARIQELKSAFKMISSHPSPELAHYFNECGENPRQRISEILLEMENLFVAAYSKATKRRGIARSRFKIATSVYYDVLEAMIISEKERLQADLTSFLKKDVFHKSLVACSLEVVLHVYEFHTFPFATTFPANSPESTISNFAFPWILDSLVLQSFDFFKVIDNFIQIKQNLPSYLKEHLTKIEEKIVSYIGWNSGSQVFESEFVASAPNASMTHFRIKFGDSLPLVDQSNSTFCREMCQDSPRKTRPTSLFLTKASKLGRQKLMQLHATLNIPAFLVSKIVSCFNYCLQNKSQLFKDRHIDQILMCCMYGVPKIHEHEVKFNEIIAAYKSSMGGTLAKLEKNVLIDNGERGPIICFYNKIFVPELESYLISLNPHSQLAQQHPANIMSTTQQQEPTERETLGGTFHLNSPFKVPLTPKTRALYCFKDSPLGSLKLVSKPEVQRRKGGAIKKLRFNHCEMDVVQS